MAIPQAFIDEVLARTDIVDLIDARVRLKKRGHNHVACCPFHQEKSPSFTVHRDKQFFYCFGCGAHGNAIGFLMQHERLGFLEALEQLAQGCGLEVPTQQQEVQQAFAPLYAVMEQVCAHYEQALRHHEEREKVVAYLKNRGLSGAVAKSFRLGLAPSGWRSLTDTLGKQEEMRAQLLELGLIIQKQSGQYYDRFRGRIMFPIRDSKGRVIGFGGRVFIAGDEPKYLNSAESVLFHKGKELYGWFEAKAAATRLEKVLVVEGYMDVIALAQLGVSFAVATLGTATTIDHLKRLQRSAKEVIFCFDGDEAGRRAAWRALEMALAAINTDLSVRFLWLPKGHDPDSLVRQEGSEAFLDRLQKAQPLSEYFFEELSVRFDVSSIEGRARLIQEAEERLNTMPDGIFRTLMWETFHTKWQRVETSKKPEVSIRRTPFRRTPVRVALALLLQAPHLLSEARIDWQALSAMKENGVPLLLKLIELLQEDGGLTVGKILARWPNPDEKAYLAKLAAWSHQVPVAGMLKELEGIFSHLKHLQHNELLETLLTKARQQPLAEEEKAELNTLLLARMQTPS